MSIAKASILARNELRRHKHTNTHLPKKGHARRHLRLGIRRCLPYYSVLFDFATPPSPVPSLCVRVSLPKIPRECQTRLYEQFPICYSLCVFQFVFHTVKKYTHTVRHTHEAAVNASECWCGAMNDDGRYLDWMDNVIEKQK